MSASSSELTLAQPNLTPLLDMVFQLITFFMLVINLKEASVDLALQLPVLGSARPVETKGEEDLLVLNIDSEGRLKVYGSTPNMQAYIATEAKQEEARMKQKNKAFKQGDELATTVVIRADKSTPFKLLNDVIKTCQKHNYRKFALKAVSRQEGA
jgi:biopolymer transport protein ExbD